MKYSFLFLGGFKFQRTTSSIRYKSTLSHPLRDTTSSIINASISPYIIHIIVQL